MYEMLTEVATGVLTQAVIGTGQRFGSATARLRSPRFAEQVDIARWFDTRAISDRVPDFDAGGHGYAPEQIEEVTERLQDTEIQAVLHELLAARLTDAPELDAERIRANFHLALDATDGPNELA